MIYDIAGLRMAINNRLNFTTRFCENYISDDQSSPADLQAAVTDEEFSAEKRSDQCPRGMGQNPV